ncbi:hypothetical protein K501DRAFT_332349 [Backusella circina FSU 941]|nr:hypothetical protein K501DRAFT_332349 [Backusella circina FSU 941]
MNQEQRPNQPQRGQQMTSPGNIRPIIASGGPIRPIQSTQPLVANAGSGMRPMLQRPPPPFQSTPNQMRPPLPVNQQRPVMTPPHGTPMSPLNANNNQASSLISPIQNMNIQSPPVQQSGGKPKRVYAVSSDIATNPTQQPIQGQQSNWQQQHVQQPYQPSTQQQQFQPAQPPNIGTPTRHHQSSAAGVGYTNAPYAHSQQQLPPELRPPTQPRPRIDPDQMPAPVQVREADEELFAEKYFGTLERDRVPMATTDYIGLDQGNCNPRFMRATVDRVPFSKDLAEKSKLPLGLVIQPLAQLRSDEVAIQVVDHGQDGPIRCHRCRAYINPACVFTHGGSKFECNICFHSNEVPSWYFANVDMSGRRIDENERPELRYGSVEFQVPKDYYSARQPQPLSYVFAIDVSVQSIQSGMLLSVCESIKNALYDVNGNSKLQNRIGILTFDKGVHFYNLSASLTSAQMLIVSDIDDMFVPLQNGFLADPTESKGIITELLNNLPHMFKDTTRPESVYTSAVRGGLHALKETGGHVFVFQTCLPNYGSDTLKARDDKALYGTDKEKNLLTPQGEKYKELGEECVKQGVCVNTWAFPSQYMDVTTVSTVSHLTGGDFRYFPQFTIKEKTRLIYQLDHDVHRETGFDGVFRIRCSDGLQVMDHYGNCHMSTYTDVDTAGIDSDKAIAAVMKHDGKLDVNRGVSFQCALLYTNREGQRRVRVHNLHLTVASIISDVFRYGDVDTTVSVLLRKTIFDLQHKNRKDLHKKLTDNCVDILTAYRVNCASSTSPGQLILPEAFKLLPVYVHGAIRSTVLRGVGNDMNIDMRSAGMCLFNSLGVAELVWTLYPRMFAVHQLAPEQGVINNKGQITLPPMMRASYDRLDPQGAYIVDTGSDLYFWLGNKVSSAFLEQVFGVNTLDQVDPNMVTFPALNTEMSHKMHAIQRQLQSQRQKYLFLRIVRQEKDAIEFLFSTSMSEDRNAEVQTYVDYMCVLHRKIQEEMKKQSS